MEGKTLAEDDGKKELALGKILEIEKAYFYLMKAYSSCLTTLNVKARECYFNRFWLTPEIVRHRIGQHVNFLQEVFLSLIAQNRDKVDSKIIKKFELYCEDMNKLSVQVAESGSTSIFNITPSAFIITPSIMTVLITLITGLLSLSDTFLIIVTPGIIIIALLLVFIFLYVSMSIFCSARKSTRMLRKTGIQEKQEKIFVILQEYMGFV